MGNDSLISRCFSTVMYIVKLVVLHIAKWCSPTSFPDKFRVKPGKPRPIGPGMESRKCEFDRYRALPVRGGGETRMLRVY